MPAPYPQIRTGPDELSVSLAASFSFLGISLAGSAVLSTDGGIRSARFEGSGSVPQLCDACPSFSGRFVAEKVDASQIFPTLTMAVDMTFLGIALSGEATFTIAGEISSFRLSGDGSAFLETLKGGIIRALALVDPSNTDNLIVKALGQALSTFSVTSFVIAQPENTVFVTYDFNVLLLGSNKLVSLKIPRLPTSLADVVEILSTLGSDITQIIAPLDFKIDIDTSWSSRLCLPAVCWCELDCDCGHVHIPHWHNPHLHFPHWHNPHLHFPFGRREMQDDPSLFDDSGDALRQEGPGLVRPDSEEEQPAQASPLSHHHTPSSNAGMPRNASSWWQVSK